MRFFAWSAGLLAIAASLFSQTLNNQALNGKYYFRYVIIATDSGGNLAGARSLIGAMTFNGSGRYTFTAQHLLGTAAPETVSGSGGYTIDSAGSVALDSPFGGGRVNARIAVEALLGSSTEATDTSFDLFVAVPAPSSTSSLSGNYWAATLEFPGATAANVRSSIFNLNVLTTGRFGDLTVNGHAANISSGRPLNQQVTNPTYTLAADGSGTISFGPTSTGAILSGSRIFYVSATGNVLLGGSATAGSHDILIAVKAPASSSSSSWNADFWAAGLRYNAAAAPVDVSGYAGSVAARGSGKAWWYRRIKELGFGTLDFSGLNSYSLAADSSGTMELARIGFGGKALVGSGVNGFDSGAYELYFASQMLSVSGAGVFLNPQKIFNAAGFAPAGNPISPGEFVALQGTGLARSRQAASPPYGSSLNSVTVLINNKPCAMQFVSDVQINCVVPYSITGSTATIVVQNSGTNSNPVTVPLAPTSPALFSLDGSGSGPGAVLHSSDYSVVNASSPAAPGETVLLFLTGMGNVDPPLSDGAGGGSNPLNSTTAAPILVLIGGEAADVQYSFLAPLYPGLYQMNVKLPTLLPGSGALPLAIQTPTAFQDQVDITVK
jgi:uncharacterized protein (TIGR03437 family)